MDKSFFATDFSLYESEDFIKIDFFEMEPVTEDDGKVTISKGAVQRITLPRKTAEMLVSMLGKNK